MRTTYRFARILSYSALPLFAALLASCATAEPAKSSNVFVGAHLPSAWPTPRRVASASPPSIQAMYFTSLSVKLGDDWAGDIITTSNTTSVELFTNLYAFAIPKTGVGRFHFGVHMLDEPAFLVRPYALHVIARNAAGKREDDIVPFTIEGRP